MPTQILMPRLSPTMEEGKLAAWHVKEGDRVRSGDVVAEIETDKATMEVEAPEDGVIEKLLLAAGTEHVPVNHPIAVLLTETMRATPQCASSLETRPAAAPQDEAARPHPEASARCARPKGEAPYRSPSPPRGEGVHATEQVMHKIAEQIRRNGGNGHAARIFASPLARRLARAARDRARGARRLGSAWPHRQARRRDCGDQA